MRKIRWILAPFAVSLIVFAVACSGGDGDDSKSSSDGSASGSGDSVSRELNLAQAATQLLELRSFRFNLSFSLDIDIEGLGDSGLRRMAISLARPLRRRSWRFSQTSRWRAPTWRRTASTCR